jgi:hypothetical protein
MRKGEFLSNECAECAARQADELAACKTPLAGDSTIAGASSNDERFWDTSASAYKIHAVCS